MSDPVTNPPETAGPPPGPLVVGLCAMPLFGGLHAMAIRFRDEPVAVLERLRNLVKGKQNGD